jgi:hypothetical protein
VFIQAGLVYFLSFGSPIRNHIMPVSNGIARITGAVVAGANVVCQLDRNISASILANQRCWIYDATQAAGVALPTDNAENQIATAVTANSITFGTLANNHAIGALVGIDPAPMYFAYAQGNSNPTVYFCSLANATYGGANNNNGNLVPQVSGIAVASNNPASGTGQYVGATGTTTMAAAPLSFRGNPQHMNWWPPGTQQNRDRMLPNNSTANAQKFFLGLLNAGFGLAIGPGAT